MKHCTVLMKPTAENKHKTKGTKTDNKVVHAERKEERDPEAEMMVRRRRTKAENKLAINASTKAILLEEDTENEDCYLERNRNF